MRAHDHEADDADLSLRPKSSRVDAGPSVQMCQAAAGGRADVLDASAVLGLQRAIGNAGVGAVLEDARSPVHDVISSGGSPLTPEVRQEMEARLGHDFGDVRVHTDSAAHESARAVNAHAYTVGSNVVFQRDRFDPSSTDGKTTLAHELTHVVQQRSGPVDGTPAAGGIKVSDPSDRFEREAAANAERVMSQPLPAASPSGTALQRTGAGDDPLPRVVQRDEAPDEEKEEESVQGSFVQREEAPEEEQEA